MSHSFYLLLHFTGLILLFMSLGALLIKASEEKMPPSRKKFLMIGHGLSLFLLLMGGFGMMAKMGHPSPYPLWFWLKLTIFILMGVAPVVIRKKPQNFQVLWIALLSLGIFAMYLGKTKFI